MPIVGWSLPDEWRKRRPCWKRIKTLFQSNFISSPRNKKKKKKKCDSLVSYLSIHISVEGSAAQCDCAAEPFQNFTGFKSSSFSRSRQKSTFCCSVKMSTVGGLARLFISRSTRLLAGRNVANSPVVSCRSRSIFAATTRGASQKPRILPVSCACSQVCVCQMHKHTQGKDLELH